MWALLAAHLAATSVAQAPAHELHPLVALLPLRPLRYRPQGLFLWMA